MTYLIVFIVAVVALMLFFKWDHNYSLRMKQEKEMREKEAEEKRQKENEELIANAMRLSALSEVARQAEVVGDEDTLESVKNMTYKGKLPEKRGDDLWMSIYDDLRILKIAGMKYRGNLKAYVGRFKGVLVPDPKNEYDPFAIMVKVEDGKHVGYIKEDQTELVRWMVGAEQPLGEQEPTLFKPYRIDGWIGENEDEDGKKWYDGCVYVKKKKD